MEFLLDGFQLFRVFNELCARQSQDLCAVDHRIVGRFFDYYREVLKGVMRLCDIWIEHPANAMAGIMKQAGFGKKLLAETVEQFKATTGNEPCSAYLR